MFFPILIGTLALLLFAGIRIITEYDPRSRKYHVEFPGGSKWVHVATLASLNG